MFQNFQKMDAATTKTATPVQIKKSVEEKSKKLKVRIGQFNVGYFSDQFFSGVEFSKRGSTFLWKREIHQRTSR